MLPMRRRPQWHFLKACGKLNDSIRGRSSMQPLFFPVTQGLRAFKHVPFDSE